MYLCRIEEGVMGRRHKNAKSPLERHQDVTGTRMYNGRLLTYREWLQEISYNKMSKIANIPNPLAKSYSLHHKQRHV